MNCPFFLPRDPALRIVFADDLVLFVQDERHRGALEHAGLII